MSIIASPASFIQQDYAIKLSCKPKNGCNLGFGLCKFCKNDFCTRHGQYQRILDKESINILDLNGLEMMSTVLNFNYALTPVQVRTVRLELFRLIKKTHPRWRYIWRIHFIDFVPHFHTISLVMLSPSYQVILDHWKTALKKIDHPNPEATKSYCQLTDNHEAWLKYIFQTSKVLQPSECPPKIDGQRWSYWGISKNWARKSKK